MPAFAVHIDSDELARQELTPSAPNPDAHAGRPEIAAHHGADDARLAARQRSERDHAGRATGGSGRSYAFRRS
jgi:hypothetical protein